MSSTIYSSNHSDASIGPKVATIEDTRRIRSQKKRKRKSAAAREEKYGTGYLAFKVTNYMNETISIKLGTWGGRNRRGHYTQIFLKPLDWRIVSDAWRYDEGTKITLRKGEDISDNDVTEQIPLKYNQISIYDINLGTKKVLYEGDFNEKLREFDRERERAKMRSRVAPKKRSGCMAM